MRARTRRRQGMARQRSCGRAILCVILRNVGTRRGTGIMQDHESSLRRRFRDVITSEEQLRAVLGAPTDRAVAKVVRLIDEHARRFIAHAPFVFVASAGADGMLDVSPKGDPAGFVKVLDKRTLAIPDRPGNRRLDTFRNVLSNPNVGLNFRNPRCDLHPSRGRQGAHRP
ncbi:pyridoxamine 5'-phosphate oxidase family protein [Rhizobium gallicum]|uniref:pyridoxamine 5'-phosphate oxidase family protein n=1 Tax=Rhizobium gallicum TaxID=56730 RepID=UPI0030B87A14